MGHLLRPEKPDMHLYERMREPVLTAAAHLSRAEIRALADDLHELARSSGPHERRAGSNRPQLLHYC